MTSKPTKLCRTCGDPIKQDGECRNGCEQVTVKLPDGCETIRTEGRDSIGLTVRGSAVHRNIKGAE